MIAVDVTEFSLVIKAGSSQMAKIEAASRGLELADVFPFGHDEDNEYIGMVRVENTTDVTVLARMQRWFNESVGGDYPLPMGALLLFNMIRPEHRRIAG